MNCGITSFSAAPKLNLTHDYLQNAAIPALNRAGIKPVGVFNVMVGPESPSLFVLIPHPSAESVLTAWERVRADQEYLERGADFLNAPVIESGFLRVESEFMAAFRDLSPYYAAARRPSGVRAAHL